MKLRIDSGSLHLLELAARMPFRYGIATLTRAPHAFLSLRLLVDGRPWRGVSADLLPPRWFTKDPRQSLREEIAAMARVIEAALEHARGLEGGSPFEIWEELHARQGRWGKEARLPPLLVNFGSSLVERALLEAFARSQGEPFWKLLHEDRLGIRLDRLHEELAGLHPSQLLPPRPLPRITARHTVGLSDPIFDEDIPAAERLSDGLPQSLEASIRAYGLRHFKVKVSGDIERDFERLGRIGDALRSTAVEEPAYSLDGNESFRSLEEFRQWWEDIELLLINKELAHFPARLLFVEQPLHRDAALEPGLERELAAWAGRPPLIIDESDAELESLPRALALGYAGTSHKNCKGVLKGIAHACLLERRRRREPGRSFILSGEDLANVGPVALLQDCAVAAALGVESVERNGHHYFAGLSAFPSAVQERVLEAHPDLYRRTPAGWPALKIEGGTLDLGSVHRAPLGVGFEIDLEPYLPLSRWKESLKEDSD